MKNAIDDVASDPSSPYYNLTPSEREEKAIELL